MATLFKQRVRSKISIRIFEDEQPFYSFLLFTPYMNLAIIPSVGSPLPPKENFGRKQTIQYVVIVKLGSVELGIGEKLQNFLHQAI